MLILYLAVLTTALYWVTKTLLPELVKPTDLKLARPPAPKLNKPSNIKPKRILESKVVLVSNADESINRVDRLEGLLDEKNKNIKLLQNELTVFLVQVREFDKVKSLLEDEIHRLREQNRIFRSELGLPQVASIINNTSELNQSNKIGV